MDTDEIKIWPAIGLAAIQQHEGGAWRAWILAKSMNESGAGWVEREDLLTFMRGVGVNGRTARRWITRALDVGLFIQAKPRHKMSGKNVYFLVGQARAAVLFGVEQIGMRATVSLKAITRRNWRANLWAAYLTGFEGPVSQKTKERLTGVSTRVQRNYQNGRAWNTKTGCSSNEPIGEAVFNFCDRDGNPADAEGLNDATELHFIVTKNGEPNKLTQRLPDERIVPQEVSRRLCKGRTRKIQQALQSAQSLCLSVQRANRFRVFHSRNGEAYKDSQQAARTLKHLSRDDSTPWERPREIFYFSHQNGRATVFQMVSV